MRGLPDRQIEGRIDKHKSGFGDRQITSCIVAQIGGNIASQIADQTSGNEPQIPRRALSGTWGGQTSKDMVTHTVIGIGVRS